MTTLAQPTTHFATVNGLRLRYLDWGNDGSRPVVCVHGYTSSAESFSAAARRLRDRAHIRAMDVRGHGASAWSPAEAYGYADQAADLAALVDQWGLDRFTLIGTSMGGIIAMTYAAAHADRLAALVLNDIGPDMEQGSQRITASVGARPEDFASLDEVIAYRRESSPITAGRPAADQEELARALVRQDADGRWRWKLDPAYVRRRVTQGPPARGDLWPALAGVACPTLVVWGTDSDVLSEAQAQRMVATLPQGELVAVPGVGHAPTLTEPAAMTALERLLA